MSELLEPRNLVSPPPTTTTMTSPSIPHLTQMLVFAFIAVAGDLDHRVLSSILTRVEEEVYAAQSLNKVGHINVPRGVHRRECVPYSAQTSSPPSVLF